MPPGDALHDAELDTSASTLGGDLRCGAAPPSTGSSRSSLPSTPPERLTSSAASRAHNSHVGPKIPAAPCMGKTSATLTTESSAVNQSSGGGSSRTMEA